MLRGFGAVQGRKKGRKGGKRGREGRSLVVTIVKNTKWNRHEKFG